MAGTTFLRCARPFTAVKPSTIKLITNKRIILLLAAGAPPEQKASFPRIRGPCWNTLKRQDTSSGNAAQRYHSTPAVGPLRRGAEGPRGQRSVKLQTGLDLPDGIVDGAE